jgi:hypothetical protein
MKPILTTRTSAAKRLGLSRNTLTRMEAAGAPFPAGRCHIDWLLAWLRDNPKFRSGSCRKKK